ELPADQQTASLIAPELGYDIYAMQVSIRIVPPSYRDSSHHRHGEAVHYYLSGAGQLQVGDETLEVGAGDLNFVPSGTNHRIVNTSDEPLRYLVAEQMPGIYLQRPVSWSAPD
ncbi:MAG: cupin domain-containing protein, partial [Dehalococcoidia bacterium]